MTDTSDETRLSGKRIATVERVEGDKYVRLTFEDGAVCTFSGLGYDGLWDEVLVSWDASESA